MSWLLIQGDARRILRGFSPGSIHLVVTSPPYPGVPLWGAEDEVQRICDEVMEECARVLVDGGVLCWQIANIPRGDRGLAPNVPLAVEKAAQCGLVWRGEIVWNKGSNAPPLGRMLDRPAIPPLCHEYILVFFKGNRAPREERAPSFGSMFNYAITSVWNIAPQSKSIGHPTPYPVALVERCIFLWSLEGEVVLDPFCGVGTTGVAAARMKRRFIGIDLNRDYLLIARRRISEEIVGSPNQPRLFLE